MKKIVSLFCFAVFSLAALAQEIYRPHPYQQPNLDFAQIMEQNDFEPYIDFDVFEKNPAKATRNMSIGAGIGFGTLFGLGAIVPQFLEDVDGQITPEEGIRFGTFIGIPTAMIGASIGALFSTKHIDEVSFSPRTGIAIRSNSMAAFQNTTGPQFGTTLGIGKRWAYSVKFNHFGIGTYTNPFGSTWETNLWEWNFDFQYRFYPSERWSVYPFLGINYAKRPRTANDSNRTLASNIGIGANYRVAGKVSGFEELKRLLDSLDEYVRGSDFAFGLQLDL